jgi:hypothetical protein
MSPEEIGTGVIQGGWEYVTLAYAMSWVVFIGYTVSLWTRSTEGGER